MCHGILNELVIENMIYVIESSGLNSSIERLVITSDSRMLLLNDVFFQSNSVVDRSTILEKAFNNFFKHVIFYQRQMSADQQDIFAYFIFVREMMHHLKVVGILLNDLFQR